jgi:hypothetical protein
MLTLAGCGDSGGGDGSSPGGGGGEDKTITIGFASAGGGSIAFTLSKGTWESAAVSAPETIINALCAIIDGTDSFAGNSLGNYGALLAMLTGARSNGNKTLTVTLAKKDTNTGSFKIKLRAVNAAFATALVANTTLTAEDVGGVADPGAGANLAIGTNAPVTVTITPVSGGPVTINFASPPG